VKPPGTGASGSSRISAKDFVSRSILPGMLRGDILAFTRVVTRALLRLCRKAEPVSSKKALLEGLERERIEAASLKTVAQTNIDP
jgi:hypothetical protein